MIKKIRNKSHRIFEEIKASSIIMKNSSFHNATVTFSAKIRLFLIAKGIKRASKKDEKTLKEKHNIILDYLQNFFAAYLSKYELKESEEICSEYQNCIWVCWWQGIENAPLIVKKCVNSIINSADGYRVIVIDKDNVDDFIEIPELLKQCQKEKKFSLTHLSDYIRFKLLSVYGGVWLDSTFFCKNFNFKECFAYPLWSIKRPDYNFLSVACGYFANYSLGCDANYRKVFAMIADLLEEYWKNNDFLIDYLLVDYLTVIAQKNNEFVKKAFSDIRANNPRCDDLVSMLSKPYSEEEYKELIKDTGLFKLSWKQKYNTTADGKITYYGMLLKDLL